MVPPATDRNAEPQKPVAKRKTSITADRREECENQGVPLRGTGGGATRTDVGGKRYWPREDEETNERTTVYNIPAWEETQCLVEKRKLHDEPCTSDTGPTSRGPIPKPIKKRDIGRIETVCDMPNCFMIPASAKAAYRYEHVRSGWDGDTAPHPPLTMQK